MAKLLPETIRKMLFIRLVYAPNARRLFMRLPVSRGCRLKKLPSVPLIRLRHSRPLLFPAVLAAKYYRNMKTVLILPSKLFWAHKAVTFGNLPPLLICFPLASMQDFCLKNKNLIYEKICSYLKRLWTVGRFGNS